ncbi:MAG: MBL fold metallo-hydrolase [Pseudomonadota bacterium]
MIRRLLFCCLVVLAQSGMAEDKRDQLRVFICGSSSPLPDLNRARACIAVLTDSEFFLFDTGSGSSTRLSVGRLPTNRLSGVIFTHFHSDHISDVYNINLTSWASGRKYPLPVYGPAGIERVVAGMNDAYELDRGYRVAHHGEALLNPDHGMLVPKQIEVGKFYENGKLSITAISVDHSPIHPAFGYRVDYGDRSVVISGDTVISRELMKASEGVDLLLHDALSVKVLELAIQQSKAAGNELRARILSDVTDYHAHTLDIVKAAEAAGVKQLAFYHMVPPPQNEAAEAIFMEGVPDDVLLTEDLMWFELPLGSDDLVVRRP